MVGIGRTGYGVRMRGLQRLGKRTHRVRDECKVQVAIIYKAIVMEVSRVIRAAV